jgi:catechol 2,3-dioxygenase-like lactoylglutathione lyase family enzyme
MASALEGEQAVFNHVGICVTDLERSKKFYEEVLRFRYWWELEAPDEGTSQLLQIPAPVGLRAVYLVRDGLVLELAALQRRGRQAVPPTGHERAGPHPPVVLRRRHPYRRWKRSRNTGGRSWSDTDMTAAIMIRDPDGQLIELTSAGWLDVLPPLPE